MASRMCEENADGMKASLNGLQKYYNLLGIGNK